MTTGLAVLRPEPGNTATADALARDGHDVLRLPLFAVRPLDWTPPDPDDVDALLVTSANAIRHAGPGLATLAALPVVAVGAATAAATRAAGLSVVANGAGDGAEALAIAQKQGLTRLLHLTGRDHRALPGPTVVATYASEPLPVVPGSLAALAGRVALLHSPRAARRLAMLIPTGRETIAIAALSDAVAAAAGDGWRATVTAPIPTDAALRTAATALAAKIDRSASGGDKRP